jgi:uncharacterized membrane protein
MQSYERHDDGHMARIVERNIKALIEHRQREETQKSTADHIADIITKFTGSMRFVFIHLLLFGTWILWNAGLLGISPFDPSFVILAMFASVEAIFLSTFVLISQNRMNAHADKRAELDLQISLLSEHEITRIITLVSAIAQKMNIEIANDKELDELKKDVFPEKVMTTMENVKNEKKKES